MQLIGDFVTLQQNQGHKRRQRLKKQDSIGLAFTGNQYSKT